MREKLKNRKILGRKGIIGDRPKEGFLVTGHQYLSTPGYDYPEEVIVNLIMFLKKCVFFEHLPTQELIKLIKRMKTVDLSPG